MCETCKYAIWDSNGIGESFICGCKMDYALSERDWDIAVGAEDGECSCYCEFDEREEYYDYCRKHNI